MHPPPWQNETRRGRDSNGGWGFDFALEPGREPGVEPEVAPPPSATAKSIALQPIKDEELKREALDKMKFRASGMLVVATLIYLATRLLESRWPWLGYVRATAEASMVGGLADWFAVTALFRYPMGIHIPHTAIIPNRKERIGRSLGNFVQNNFLSPTVISARLQGAHIAAKLAEWLSQPEHGEVVG